MSLESGEPRERLDPDASAELPARRVLDDPRVLRAFAHPLRLRLHRLLIREGVCSAAYAGRELGISQALASHHLHQLEKYGFAEQLVGQDRRERPWRALSTSTTWLGADTTERGAVATDLLEQALAEQAVSHLLAWQRRRRLPEQSAWHDVAGLDTNLLYLSSDEADDLGKAFDALCAPYLNRRFDASERHDDLRPVEVTLLLVPLAPTASGS
jgi:DNA-binding transcriptional ArsR family regulator